MTSRESGGTFATLTHARVRAAQGDVAGAARILRIILAAQPEHREARLLLMDLEERVPIIYREPEDVRVPEVRTATAVGLKERFREALEDGPRDARLIRWLERVRRNRGERHV